MKPSRRKLWRFAAAWAPIAHAGNCSAQRGRSAEAFAHGFHAYLISLAHPDARAAFRLMKDQSPQGDFFGRVHDIQVVPCQRT